MAPSPAGRACLSFHTYEYDGSFASQDNRKFIGSVEPIAEGTLFRVERELVAGSLPNKRSMLKAMYYVWRTRGRRPEEAGWRGQPVPRVAAG